MSSADFAREKDPSWNMLYRLDGHIALPVADSDSL